MPQSERPPTGGRLHPSGRFIPAGLDDALVSAVVDDFYGQARQDPLLGPIFNRVIPADEWPQHLATIADFWSSMLLGSGSYTGRPMPKHLAIHDLGDAHFTRWLALFRGTVERLCPPEVALLFVDRAERIGHSFRIGLAMHRGQDSLGVGLMRAQRPDEQGPGKKQIHPGR